MAKYTSKYVQLSFYVDGVLKRFSNGEYATNDADEIAILDGLKDAIRVDEPKAKADEEPKTEAKPKTSTAKAPARKASAK